MKYYNARNINTHELIKRYAVPTEKDKAFRAQIKKFHVDLYLEEREKPANFLKVTTV